MKTSPRPVHRGIIRLLLTHLVLASVLTPVEAQTKLSIEALEVVDVHGDLVGVFYPYVASRGQAHKRTKEGFVPFMYGGRAFLLLFTVKNEFLENDGGLYESSTCAGPPLWYDRDSILVAPPGQTVYINDATIPRTSRRIQGRSYQGQCHAEPIPYITELLTFKPAARLTRLFTRPFLIQARQSPRRAPR